VLLSYEHVLQLYHAVSGKCIERSLIIHTLHRFYLGDQITEVETVGTCSALRRCDMFAKYFFENLKVRWHVGDLGGHEVEAKLSLCFN
jgi:hypothetical protein